jgi:hypothetical protein
MSTSDTSSVAELAPVDGAAEGAREATAVPPHAASTTVRIARPMGRPRIREV